MNVWTDVWQFQANMARRLLRWAGAHVGAGLMMALLGDRFWRGMGLQFSSWGAIDVGLAWIALRNARRNAAEPDAHTASRQKKAYHNLLRLLKINTGLDVVYVTGGVLLARSRGKENAFIRGTGWGIVLQGAFLFVYDLLHALDLTKRAP